MARTPDSHYQWTPASEHRNRLTNIYEPLQPYFLSEMSKAAGCELFVDIGANIGFYSVFMAAEISAQEVYAFEPMSATADEARRNFHLNNLADIAHLRQIALSSSPGSATMAVISNLSGANSILDTSIHKDQENIRTESVPTSTLDEELPFSGRRVAVKIDVEGHELDVLNGGRGFFSGNQAVVQMESYDDKDAEADVAETLVGMGYRKVISVGPDHYFASNDLEIDATDIAERALARFLTASKQPAPKTHGPLRKRIFRGVTVELSPRLSNLFRRSH